MGRSIDQSPSVEESTFISRAVVHHITLASKNAMVHIIWPKVDFVSSSDPKEHEMILNHLDTDFMPDLHIEITPSAPSVLMKDAEEGFEFKQFAANPDQNS
jgi:hypothetical protein